MTRREMYRLYATLCSFLTKKEREDVEATSSSVLPLADQQRRSVTRVAILRVANKAARLERDLNIYQQVVVDRVPAKAVAKQYTIERSTVYTIIHRIGKNVLNNFERP